MTHRPYREQLGKGNEQNGWEFRVWYYDSANKIRCHIVYGENVQILNRGDAHLIGRNEIESVVEFGTHRQ